MAEGSKATFSKGSMGHYKKFKLERSKKRSEKYNNKQIYRLKDQNGNFDNEETNTILDNTTTYLLSKIDYVYDYKKDSSKSGLYIAPEYVLIKTCYGYRKCYYNDIKIYNECMMEFKDRNISNTCYKLIMKYLNLKYEFDENRLDEFELAYDRTEQRMENIINKQIIKDSKTAKKYI